MTALIALQALQVLILWLHDWVPLGRLTDPAAAQAADGRARLIRVTLVQCLPFTIGLAATLAWARTGHPGWVWPWLWVSYLLLFAGELRAWWWPYLFRAEPARAARYRAVRAHRRVPPRTARDRAEHAALRAAGGDRGDAGATPHTSSLESLATNYGHLRHAELVSASTRDGQHHSRPAR